MNYNGYQDPPPEYLEQLQKLNEKQAAEQALSHDILYQLLCTAETFALGKDGDRHFKGYEFFNSSSKSESELREQFLIQTDTFKNSYRFFLHDHKKYDFPEKLDKIKIINLLNNWKSFVKEEDKSIYDATINLLKKNKNKVYNNFNNKKYNNMIEEELDDIQMGNFADIMTKISYSNDMIAQNAKKKLNTEGKFIGKVKLDAKNTIDPTISKINNYGNINIKKGNIKYSQKIGKNQYYE